MPSHHSSWAALLQPLPRRHVQRDDRAVDSATGGGAALCDPLPGGVDGFRAWATFKPPENT